ncbi:hypothetical protein LV478_03255 [Komagataeibacter oboediens]|uniref:hypothetical protein n=1 Tax=Komagataeibacter oboediens TaxID=65958 RepID=UPI0023DA7516|nr:hypothetical protein [Komagataeibacter oboediens]WEQ52584.1 hypothetical protein LV478_03255 [Komagataeibacter oboediens]
MKDRTSASVMARRAGFFGDLAVVIGYSQAVDRTPLCGVAGGGVNHPATRLWLSTLRMVAVGASRSGPGGAWVTERMAVRFPASWRVGNGILSFPSGIGTT